MMKKKYVSPKMEVYEILQEIQLDEESVSHGHTI